MSNWAKLQEDLTGLKVVKRARHAIHFQRGNEIEAHFVGKPCHFQDSDGLWKPIDTGLIRKPNGWYGCPHSDVVLHPDGRVAVEGTGYAQLTELPGAGNGLADGDRLVREFDGGRQFLSITEDGFRQEIVLDKVPDVKGAAIKRLLAAESGTLPGKYKAHALKAVDAAGGEYVFTSQTSLRDWLEQAMYPVVIDPDFTAGTGDKFIYGLNANYTTAHTTSNTTESALNYLRIGQVLSGAGGSYGCYRAFAGYDTSSIEDAAAISQVNFKATCITDFSSAADFDIQIVKQNWTGTQETDYDECLSGTADDAIWRNTSGMSLNTQYTSGNLNTAWVNKSGTTYYSFRSSRDFAGTNPGTGGFLAEYIYLASQDHATVGYRPVLTVTYTAGGALLNVNMNGQMQNLSGGMRG